MKLEKQSVKLNINVPKCESIIGKNKKHGILFPNNIRCVISGPSGSGKTCIMMGLLENKNGLRFKNVYVYSKSLFQEKYQRLQRIISGIKGMNFYGFQNGIVPLEKIAPFSVIIFDDVACESQREIQKFYCMARHKNTDCFYLSQSFAQIPKHLLRDNLNMIVLLRQDSLNLKHVYDNHVAGDMSFGTFQKMCSICWEEPHGFLSIITDYELNKGRYRKGFDAFFKDFSR